MEALIRSGGLQGYRALMLSLGVDPRPVLKKHKIPMAALRDGDTLISLPATFALVEESAHLTRCHDFGLRLAASQSADALGIFSIVVQSATTLSQAIDDAARYIFLHSPAFEVSYDDPSPLFADCGLIRFDIRLPPAIRQRQSIDACIGHMYRLTRVLGGDQLTIRGVSLPHTPLASPRVYSQFFGVPVYFEQAQTGIHAERKDLLGQAHSINPAVRQIALDFIARSCPAHSKGLADAVRGSLRRTLGLGAGTKEEIGALLGMHPRTLQRRLEVEGTFFEKIREEVMRSATSRFLLETDLPLQQVAIALGFSEQSSLTRACKRWFGQSPSSIRKSS